MTQPDEYQLLTQDERDEMLAETLLSQERDLFAHRINKDRYDRILAAGRHSQEWRDRIQQLRNETEARETEVASILEALRPQLPPKARLDAARTRIDARAATVSRA